MTWSCWSLPNDVRALDPWECHGIADQRPPSKYLRLNEWQGIKPYWHKSQQIVLSIVVLVVILSFGSATAIQTAFIFVSRDDHGHDVIE